MNTCLQAKNQIGTSKVIDHNPDLIPGGDTNCHSDTFFNCLEAFIYLKTIPADGPSFKYYIKSHLMTPQLKKLNVKMSIQNPYISKN